MPMTAIRTAGAVLAGGVLFHASLAFGQQLPGCALVQRDDPPRSVHDCGGLIIEAEAAAALRPAGAGNVAPDAVEVEGGAVLIDIEPGRGPFQILTPHAIASVRGTVYAVDVGETETSVFVLEGFVQVSREDGAEPVELLAGEGVDVTADQPLTVREWGQPRVDALLARFGR